MSVLKGRAVVLVVTGGIAAYKAAELARLLIRDGAEVRVAMTEAGTRFVTPLTFEALTGNPVAVDMWAPAIEIGHISLADWADAVVIAPATANIIGKMACGLADDFVSTFLLAVRAPVVVCPAMNVNMFENPAVQANLARLKELGRRVVEPETGYLACGWEAKGRLPEPALILEEVRAALSPHDLEGLSVMVTAGPTREPWDSIRFLSNRSTGRMGYALARTARRRGARVILISGPVASEPPFGVETIPVESTVDMLEAVKDNFGRIDILVKAAAPGDFRPANRVEGKVKKTETPQPVELARNPDILAEMGKNKGNRILVGFAAEYVNLLENAKGKLESKNLDLIVANQIGAPGAAFGAETNQVSILDRDGQVQQVPLQDKEEVANVIWDRVSGLVGKRKA